MTFFADSKWASHSLFSHGNIVVYFPAMSASFHLSNCHFNISQSSLLLHTGQHSLHYNTLHINDTHTRLLCQHFSFLRFAFHVCNFVHSLSSVSCVKSIKCVFCSADILFLAVARSLKCPSLRKFVQSAYLHAFAQVW